jgi:hypothetical protein
LAGLHLMAKEQNIDWERLTTGLVKMEKAVAEVRAGQRQSRAGL